MRVLVVDDDSDMRLVVRLYLTMSDESLEVVGEAGDGRAAIDQWAELEPDLIVLDVSMPGLSGIEVARQILAEDPTQPIILFSAYLHPSVIAEAEKAGVRECIDKDQLQRLAEAATKHGRRGGASGQAASPSAS